LRKICPLGFGMRGCMGWGFFDLILIDVVEGIWGVLEVYSGF
jgi:hypothetical protein